MKNAKRSLAHGIDAFDDLNRVGNGFPSLDSDVRREQISAVPKCVRKVSLRMTFFFRQNGIGIPVPDFSHISITLPVYPDREIFRLMRLAALRVLIDRRRVRDMFGGRVFLRRQLG